MMELRVLIDRLENLTQPCRYTDDLIATAIWGEPVPCGNPGSQKVLTWWKGAWGRSISPEFTGKIDDALLAVPDHDKHYLRLECYSDGWYATVKVHSRDDLGFEGHQKPAAIAICIAAMKARAQVAAEGAPP
jgi:hypothetical protein